ncbi:hypothetical protein GCM10017771_52240 [Streptomyces capitiformicae]|uniref:Uncharacterized protein n=1 Tax=Streptomyces capitiformicae TaxID=2014920 RepID=A0A918Z2X6_9ACTN|nr:hypothetical protein GCM10017771_52240 [Streptomyces capitiformicae]
MGHKLRQQGSFPTLEQFQVEALLQDREAFLIEPNCLSMEGVAVESAEGRSAPKGERGAVVLYGLSDVTGIAGGPSSGYQPGELVDVPQSRIKHERVAEVMRLQGVSHSHIGQRPTHCGNTDLYLASHGGGRILLPYHIDDVLDGNDFPGPAGQGSQQ